MSNFPDLTKAEQNDFGIEIDGKMYRIPASVLDKYEHTFEDMSEEELKKEFQQYIIIKSISENPKSS